MPGIALNGSPTPMQMASPDNQSQGRLGQNEQYASPVEHQLLDKVMSLVHQALTDPKKLQNLDYMLHKATDLGVAIGNIGYQLLVNIFIAAKNGGQALPASVFLGQGGAVMQTIEMLMHVAESAHIPMDPDHVRETAMGVVMMMVKKNYNLFQNGLQQAKQPPQQQQQQGAPQGPPQGGPPPGPPQGGPPMMAANPMAHAVGRGLQQQGLLSGG